jgi:hypothetical protein
MLPCKECILVPICKHKYYEELVFSCRPVAEYLKVERKGELHKHDHKKIRSTHLEHRKKVKTLVKVLSPTKWKIGALRTFPREAGGFDIILVENDNKVHWAKTF